MHYDDFEYEWGIERTEQKAQDFKRYQFDKIEHITQGAYKFKDQEGVFWVPKYAISGIIHPDETHYGYVVIDPFVEFSACYWNDRERQTTSLRVPEAKPGYRKHEITPPANLQPIEKVKVLSLHSHNGELFAVCEDGKVRGFDFDNNEWYDLPAIMK